MHQILNDPFELIIPVGLLVACIIAGFIGRRLLFGMLQRWARRSESHLDKLVIETLRGPIILWSVILGLHLATQNSEIPRRYLETYIPRTLATLWGLSLIIAASHLAGSMVRFYGRDANSGARAITSLSEKLVQVSVLLLGILWLLKVVFDVSLTPYLATLGVGGIAVALALQDTLSNLFAGFYVSVSGLVHIGDYILLNSGEEGYVADINWRCTTMRNKRNNLIVIPNNKLGQAIFTNYFLPDGRMGGSIMMGVDGNSDIDRVEAVLRDELKTANEINGVLIDPPPTIRFNPGPWNGALVWQIGFSVSTFVSLPEARSEIRKRLFKRLRREGITVSFPTPVVPSAGDAGSD